MKTLQEHITEFSEKYKDLQNFKYLKQETTHYFFWDDFFGSTHLILFYHENGMYALFDQSKELKKKFELSDYGEEDMVCTNSPEKLFEVLNYEMEKRLKQ